MFIRIVLILIIAATASLPVRAAELVMFEQQACSWCERFIEEIGPIYPKTDEGKAAPLRRVDIYDELPQDLANIRPSSFTPTFVLVDNGVEIGRIRGYPGEDFFWWMLSELMTKLAERQKAEFVSMQ